jgi:phage terminase small subunit
MSFGPLHVPDLDRLTVERFAQLVDERAGVQAELERGFVLEEPLVTPTGAVAGVRHVPNPAASMLCGIDKELTALSDRLGLTPAARAKLGLTMSSAEKQALEVGSLLDARFRKVETR